MCVDAGALALGANRVAAMPPAQPTLAVSFRVSYVTFMNTYKAIPTPAGKWAVQWFADGVPYGFVWGSSHLTERDAEAAAFDFALMEYMESPRSSRLSTGKRRQPLPHCKIEK